MNKDFYDPKKHEWRGYGIKMIIYQVWKSLFYDYDDGGPDKLLGSFFNKENAINLRNNKARIEYNKLNKSARARIKNLDSWFEEQGLYYINEIEVK